MSKKLLTEELILKRLKDKGVTVPNETGQTDQLAQIMLEYGCSIVNDWQAGCDAFFYTETTADDYEVFVATEDERRANINEDVYYYTENWFEKLADYLRDGYTVYIDSYQQDEYGFEEVIEALYEEWYIEQYHEVEDELLDEGYKYSKPE
jgi:preprotein translocase subunit SecA